jgi:carboxyl-terminal processing protease
MDKLFNYIEKEDDSLVFNAEEYKMSETSIKLRLKAYLARNLWDTNEFYQIYNDSNEILQRAVRIIQDKEYEKVNLDH